MVTGYGGRWREVAGCGGLWRAVVGCGGPWRAVAGAAGAGQISPEGCEIVRPDEARCRAPHQLNVESEVTLQRREHS